MSVHILSNVSVFQAIRPQTRPVTITYNSIKLYTGGGAYFSKYFRKIKIEKYYVFKGKNVNIYKISFFPPSPPPCSIHVSMLFCRDD